MPPEPPPIPINLLWEIFPVAVRVGFDRPLTPAVLNTANWSARRHDERHTFTSAVAIGTGVNLSGVALVFPDPGPDQVDYTPPPFDVISTFDQPAAAFRFPP